MKFRDPTEPEEVEKRAMRERVRKLVEANVARQEPERLRVAKPQPYRRLIDFSYRGRYASKADAVRVAEEAVEQGASRDTISNVEWRTGAGSPCTLWLWWTYGWVKGGWRGDGERFVATVLRRAGITAVENEAVEIEGEEKEPVERQEVMA